MIEAIIRFSVRNKLIIGLLVLGLIGGGVYSLQHLPIDAVPDITNNQVQIVTVSPSLAPQEVEQFITYPVEVAMANIPDVIEIRSISRFGLSVVTVVFEDDMPMLDARQFVKEQISIAEGEIPDGLGQPELMPITTGLGEIYQYVLQVKPDYEHEYDAMRLRTIQDWIVKRQLAGIAGIIETSSFGGYLKQYEVALDPVLLQSHDVSMLEVYDALAQNNQNSGGSYIEKNTNAYYIRTEGVIQSLEDIKNIVVANPNGTPVLIRDVAAVGFGSAKRFGAMTMDGKGEVVGGITLMLKGANSSEAIENVHERIASVQRSLPEGVELIPYLDRSDLVAKTFDTVKHNLLEGGLIVIFVLVLLLGNLRVGLIIASVIPLAMLFALILMNYFGVSANLMSLGAIDFGIVVDGAVIIVEGVLHTIFTYHVGKQLTQTQLDGIVTEASAKLFRSAVFGVFIILVVFIPIMTLTGIEGKMFRPMAMTFAFAVLGALLLSLTYVPMMTALGMPKKIKATQNFSDRIMNGLRSAYRPVLEGVLRLPALILATALGLFVAAFFLFRSMGAEFIPTLEEGDLAMQMAIQPGSALQESIKTTGKAEQILLENFPEVKHVVSKIGTAEVPTDPMAVEDADIMIILKPKEEWTSAENREDLVAKMKEKLDVIIGASFEFTQPIQLRFNELMTGAKTDIAIKIFGENTDVLKTYADQAALLVQDIPGAADVKVEQTEGLPQLVVRFDRQRIAQYGLNIQDLNTIVRAAYAGEKAGVVFENERKFDLVLRLTESYRSNLDLTKLFVHLPNGSSVPLSELASLDYTEGPMQISRENARRRINIGINVRNRDVASLVADIEQRLNAELNLPPGYTIAYGGQFENLEKASRRLSIAVPVALALIFFLLFFTFGKVKYALLIFTAVPLSAIGGVAALWLRGMPFSISAGVGFIALFGVAVLNGIVLISTFNQLREEGMTNIREVVIEGALTRLRPVLMTATVAALGFLPMALSTSNGAEVQKPLATVVIGGLITATLLTLLVMPVLYFLINRRKSNLNGTIVAIGVLFFSLSANVLSGQNPFTLEEVVQHARQEHPLLRNAKLDVQQAQLEAQAGKNIPQTQFSFTGGQIDGKLLDYNFSASQSLGNLAANRQQEQVAFAKTVQSQTQTTLLNRELDFQIRQSWYAYLYHLQRQNLQSQQQQLVQTVAEKAALQLEVGDISRLELTLAENQRTQIRQALVQTDVELQVAIRALRQAAFLTESSTFATADLPRLPLPDTILLNEQLTAPLQQQIFVHREEVILAEKQLKPTYSLGYFNQSLRPEYSLQGVTVGLSVPLWKKPQQARIEQAQLLQLQARNILDYQEQQLAQQLDLAIQQVTLLRNQLDENGADLLRQAEQLRALSETQLRNGEINYFQYWQSVQAALQSELDYLDMLYQYDQAVLYLEFLTQ